MSSSRSVSTTLAPLLFGSWLNSALYMMELMWMYRYFRLHRPSRDKLRLRLTLLGLLFTDTLSTLGNYAAVWLYGTVHFGDYEYLHFQHWPFIVFLTTTGTSAMIVQFFLLERAWRLCRGSKMPILVGIVGLAILVSYANSLWTAAFVVLYENYDERYRLVTPVTVWLTVSVACDVTIAGILFYKLNQARKKVSTYSRETLKVPVQRLMIMALESGAVTSFLAIVGLSLYLGFKTSNLPLAPGYCLGRVYTLTMLFNLHVRDSLQAEAAGSSHGGVVARLADPVHPSLGLSGRTSGAAGRTSVSVMSSSFGGVSTIKAMPRQTQTQTGSIGLGSVGTISLAAAYNLPPPTPRIGGPESERALADVELGMDGGLGLYMDEEKSIELPRRAARTRSTCSRSTTRRSVSISSVEDDPLATLQYRISIDQSSDVSV